jgi:hypothetical protein
MRNDFLAEQTRPSAFDKIERGVHLIRAVDGQIDAVNLVGLDEWNASLNGTFCRAAM